MRHCAWCSCLLCCSRRRYCRLIIECLHIYLLLFVYREKMIFKCHFKYQFVDNKKNLPKNVEQMYSEIWLPDLLDSLKWDSSLFSIRLNWTIRSNNITMRMMMMYIQDEKKRSEKLIYRNQWIRPNSIDDWMKPKKREENLCEFGHNEMLFYVYVSGAPHKEGNGESFLINFTLTLPLRKPCPIHCDGFAQFLIALSTIPIHL